MAIGPFLHWVAARRTFLKICVYWLILEEIWGHESNDIHFQIKHTLHKLVWNFKSLDHLQQIWQAFVQNIHKPIFLPAILFQEKSLSTIGLLGTTGRVHYWLLMNTAFGWGVISTKKIILNFSNISVIILLISAKRFH